MKVYGSHLCPDTLYAISVLKSKGIDFEFVNASASLADMKRFIKLREENPSVYDAVRAAGGLGIPAFLTDDGSLTLDLADAVK